MNTSRNTVVLLPNMTKRIDESLVQNLLCRMKQCGCTIRISEEAAEKFSCFDGCVFCASDVELFRGADVIIVLGGDGSMIEAARRSVGLGIPIAGINFGRLGYLTEIEINELELVDFILSGGGTIEKRIMLDVSIQRAGQVIMAEIPALNDVVLTNGPVSKLLSFELHCNGELVEHCFADGMILSTPTGSTAYSLAAGGPVLDPCLDCICSTPICPQTMNNRPVIFGGNSVLEFRNMKCPGNAMYLSVDGREAIELFEDDVVRVAHSAYTTSLIRVKDGGFLKSLRLKLS